MTLLGGFPVSAGKGVLHGVTGVFKYHKDHESSSSHDIHTLSPEETTTPETSAGRAMTHLGGLPVSAGKSVLHGVAGVFKHHKDHDHESSHDTPLTPAHSTASAALQEATTITSLESSLAVGATKPSIDSSAPPSNEPGTLKVVVVNGSLSDDSKAYVVLRVGNKEVKTKHSTKTTHPEW